MKCASPLDPQESAKPKSRGAVAAQPLDDDMILLEERGAGNFPSVNKLARRSSMACLSSSWKPHKLFRRSPSPLGRGLLPADPAASPVDPAQDTATTVAWRSALSTYRKSLTDKEFSNVTAPTGPQDVVREVDRWQLQQSSSRYAKACTSIRNGLARMERFTGAIDMLAQGTPAPGCLLWGGIKVALMVCIFYAVPPALSVT